MYEYKTFAMPSMEGVTGVAGMEAGSSCMVSEEEFPCLGKCMKIHDASGVKYIKRCEHCSVWTSLPDGTHLEVAHIFDCTLYGYGKRIKNSP